VTDKVMEAPNLLLCLLQKVRAGCNTSMSEGRRIVNYNLTIEIADVVYYLVSESSEVSENIWIGDRGKSCSYCNRNQ
jgi:hypothetical protein